MAEIARDSGICVDNDSESVSETSSNRDHNLSYVQRLRNRFECLAKEKDLEFHEEVNWWLDEEARVNDHSEEDVTDARNASRNLFVRLPSLEHEVKNYSKQSSIKSQTSHDSNKEETKLIITPATPVKSPSTPKIFPVVTFTDYQEKNESNDTDSFDSESEEEAKVVVEETENVSEETYIRRSNNVLRLSRPASATSVTSK